MTKHTNNSAEQIKRLLNSNKISQADLARELGISRSAITQKFQVQRFTLRDISSITDYFDVSTDWLLARTEQQKLPDKTTQ